ncbi:MAG: GDP-mannose 4,6-dehydratase [Thermoflexales bacterium]|nr:GDP-mannose 4,6-dehydratase [Thermoflexales bacterium]
MSVARRRILITGATGCAGTHLSELALAHQAEVFGLAHSGTFTPGVSGQSIDLTDRAAVDEYVRTTQPDWIFHLAAIIPGVAVPPERYIAVNVTGTYSLLDAVRRYVPQARTLIASSSAVYGRPVQTAQAIQEDAPLQPQSLYATTKAAQDLLAMQFFTEHDLHTVRGRTFNQTGPREPANLVCATIARQVARIEAGLQEPIVQTVTLLPRRDFTDVRDVVAGYWAALEQGAGGEAYNICSGHSTAIREVAEILIGLSTVRHIEIVESNPVPGPRAILDQVGDGSKLKACSGWQPRVALEQSLRDLLDEWRTQVALG